MPHGIVCPQCRRSGFVRVEHVIKGGGACRAMYCGGCEHTWTIVDIAMPEPNMPLLRRKPRTKRFGPKA